MLDLVFNIAYLAVIKAFAVAVTVPVPPMELHGIAPFEAKPLASYFSAERHCRFHGVAVAYERDWEVVSENTMTQTKTVLPAEPGKVHSYAVLINKKTCPGKEPERMFLVGSDKVGYAWTKDRGLVEGWKVMMASLPVEKEKQPQWLPQVMKVIEESEASKPFVKEFADYTRAGAAIAKAEPQSKEALPVAPEEASATQ